MERIALSDACVQKILFLQGGGGGGKSALTKLRQCVWGANHRSVDCSVFQSDDEFRKQPSEFYGSKFCTISEAKDKRPVESDVLKRAIDDSTLASRPNYAVRTLMLRFGKCFWLWELNEIPKVKSSQGEGESIRRRVLAGHAKAKFATDIGQVNESEGRYLRDSNLYSFLSQRVVAVSYLLHFFLPFCAKNPLDQCVRAVENPAALGREFGSTLAQDSQKLAQQLLSSAREEAETTNFGGCDSKESIRRKALNFRSNCIEARIFLFQLTDVQRNGFFKCIHPERKCRSEALYAFCEVAPDVLDRTESSDGNDKGWFRVLIPNICALPKIQPQGRTDYVEIVDVDTLRKYVDQSEDRRKGMAESYLLLAEASGGAIQRRYRCCERDLNCFIAKCVQVIAR